VTYTVVAGDTLYSIARRFGTTVDSIASANGISDPSDITAGQVLVIPGDGTVQPTSAPTQGATQTPGSTGPAQVIQIGDTSQNVVAFTFDAGADAGYTVMILDTLKANGIHASFGMTGKWAETYPDLLRRMVNEGHTLINHSYDHPSFTGASSGNGVLEADRWDQLERTEDIVREIAGATTKPYFRPPFGDYDQSVNEDVGAIGYRYNIMWTVDSRGWMGIPEPQIKQRCLDLSEPGAIYIFHVGAASADGTALQGIIDGLHAQGYEIGDINAVLN
jgi:peptidoglycan/xylan/chitin deacetylase (PgdA/CDA1 family)